ncbi:Glucooligosaccharide oxidase [Echria macrotheca]|uniref:Glucooligosaccharide oxidase n=1 Tax=Echria macrotheca TaxID=438768 RepID=A0AAJ0BL68_9PEZI|nr:Glucooligosaccharide oxidase [Echria macrotheca]
MRLTASLALGLLPIAAEARAVVSRADIEACLTSAGVPIDTKGSADWQRDAAPFNLRVPYTPVAVSVPTTIAQIQKSVICGKSLGIKVSAKSGGHSYASIGLGGEDGHLVVELDRMYNVSLAEGNIAVVQPGTRLGHLATELATKYGRAIAHGTCPGVGISGHFLHGGFGFSSHKHGLALDQVVGMTVVLADGSVVEASATENPDLFWALRGAGSNFGIVASWRINTFPAPTTLTWFSVSLGWNKSTSVAGLEALETYVRTKMPAELNFRVSDYSRGQPGIEGLFYGTDAELRVALAPLLAVQPTANLTESHTVDWLQAAVHYSFFDTIDWLTPSPQENFFAKSLTLKGLSGDAAKAFVDYWWDTSNKVTDRDWWFQLDMHGGNGSTITALANDATAYAHRDKLYIIQFYDRIANNATYPAGGQSFLNGWVDAITKPLSSKDWGMYINYADTTLDRDTAQKVYYRDNLAKLQKLKAKYDPTELFYYPQSIKPAA